jgi:hypothetical protein
MAPRRSPRDSWGDMSTSSEDGCVLGKVSRFELLAHSQNRCVPNRLQHFSPKVFPAGCPTANSPASAVLGPSRASPIPHVPLTNGIKAGSSTPQNSAPSSHTITSAQNGVSSRSRSATPTGVSHSSPLFSSTPLVNGDTVRSVTPVFNSHGCKLVANRTPVGMSRSVTSSPAFDRSVHNSDRSMGSTRSLSGNSEPSPAFTKTSESSYGPPAGYSPRLTTPSPAFNRNPLPYSAGSAFRSVTPSPPRSAGLGASSTPMGHRRTLSAGSGDVADPNPRVSFTSSNCSSVEELTARNDELEHKRKQVRTLRFGGCYCHEDSCCL